MNEHLKERLIADPFASRDLAGFGEIRRGQAQRDLYTARAAEVGHEQRSLRLLKSSHGRLPFEKIAPLRTCPPLRFLVFVVKLRRFCHLLFEFIHSVTLRVRASLSSHASAGHLSRKP